VAWVWAFNPRRLGSVLLRSRDGGRDWRRVQLP